MDSQKEALTLDNKVKSIDKKEGIIYRDTVAAERLSQLCQTQQLLEEHQTV